MAILCVVSEEYGVRRVWSAKSMEYQKSIRGVSEEYQEESRESRKESRKGFHLRKKRYNEMMSTREHERKKAHREYETHFA